MRQLGLEDRYICHVLYDDENVKVFPNVIYEVITDDIEVVKQFVKDVEARYFS